MIISLPFISILLFPVVSSGSNEFTAEDRSTRHSEVPLIFNPFVGNTGHPSSSASSPSSSEITASPNNITRNISDPPSPKSTSLHKRSYGAGEPLPKGGSSPNVFTFGRGQKSDVGVPPKVTSISKPQSFYLSPPSDPELSPRDSQTTSYIEESSDEDVERPKANGSSTRLTPAGSMQPRYKCKCCIIL